MMPSSRGDVYQRIRASRKVGKVNHGVLLDEPKSSGLVIRPPSCKARWLCVIYCSELGGLAIGQRGMVA